MVAATTTFAFSWFGDNDTLTGIVTSAGCLILLVLILGDRWQRRKEGRAGTGERR